jgi:hypothetical protein
LLIVWSARIFVVFYVVRLAIDLLVADPWRRERMARLVWTAGCFLFLFHLACAFQFLHNWSHAAAMDHVARRTYEVIGVSWGGGIYVNYAFALLWVVDVVWWWLRAAQGQPTPAAYYWAVQAIFAFIFLNATAVFGPPFWKWIVAATLILLVAGRILFRRAPNLPIDEVSAVAKESPRTL